MARPNGSYKSARCRVLLALDMLGWCLINAVVIGQVPLDSRYVLFWAMVGSFKLTRNVKSGSGLGGTCLKRPSQRAKNQWGTNLPGELVRLREYNPCNRPAG
jgi:hypothetical protein